jgi:thiol-disulfide isomerase/thioredoxin
MGKFLKTWSEAEMKIANRKLVLGCLHLFVISCAFFSPGIIAGALPGLAPWKVSTLKELESSVGKRQRPILIYWGAEWCPPCNQMKAEVFSKLEFKDKIAAYDLIYVDGDAIEAQKWSDRFQVTGYPTLLFLSKELEEMYRFVGFVPLASIEALLGLGQTNDIRSRQILLSLVASSDGKPPLSPRNYRVLSFLDWSTASEEDLGGKKPVSLALDVLDHLPVDAKIERLQLIQSIMYLTEDLVAEKEAELQQRYESFLVEFEKAGDMSAPILNFMAQSGSVLKWFLPSQMTAEEQRRRVDRWNQVVSTLSQKSQGSLAEKVDRTVARAVVLKLVSNSKTQDQTTRHELLRQMQDLELQLLQLKDFHLQTSVVPVLADGLESIGEVDEGVEFLMKVAKRSAVPHYFLGHAAHFLEEAGRRDEALKMREDGYKLVKGRASKLQWTFSYLKSIEKARQPNSGAKRKDLDKTFVNVWSALFDQAFRYADGFSGRNVRYLRQAVGFIRPTVDTNTGQKLIFEKQRAKCRALKDNVQKETCLNVLKI